MVFLKRVTAMAALSSILLFASASVAAESRSVGKEEEVIVTHEIYTKNMTNPGALFARTGGSVSKIIEDSFPVIKFSPSEDAGKGSFWVGPGYFKNPETEETLGLTNRNYKYAKLSMDIKLNDGAAADNLAINFGYVPISSSGIDVNFTYFGRYARNNEEIDKYVKGTAEWQTVEIPLSIFKSTSTNKYCIPGTESWRHEIIDWSKFNLLGISIDATAENREIYVRNITLSYPEFLGCAAEYKLVDEDGYTPDTIQMASGKKIYGNVIYKNNKTTDENILVMLLKYKDDKMTEIKSYIFTADALSEGEWQTPGFIETDELGDTQIHMLVWDNKDGMRSAGAAEILR